MAIAPLRRLTPERMDDPCAGRVELASTLKFLRLVNRRLGGTAAALRHLKHWLRNWPRQEPIRILDVATGSADIPLAISRWVERFGLRVQVTTVDSHPTTLALAREHVKNHPDIHFRLADARQLMDQFASGSFHFAHAGMFLHHLPDIEVMTVLRIMDRLTTRGLIWNDLIRGWPGRIGVRLLTPFAPEFVRHDARVSVEAGFTRHEAIELAERAGLPRIRYRRHFLYRFTLTSTK